MPSAYRYEQIMLEPMPFLRERDIWIYLPTNYDTSTQHYPVLYFHDGQNLTHHRKEGSGTRWNLEQFLDTNTHCIVVAIDCISYHRLNEYAPFAVGDQAKTMIENAKLPIQSPKSEGAAYIAWLVQELKAHIDATYRTLPEQSGMAGSSMGGVISLYAQLKYPTLFSWSGVISPAYWISPEAFLHFIEQHPPQPHHTIYTSMGTNENGLATPSLYLEHFERTTKLLQAKLALGVQSSLVDKGRHHESTWANLVMPLFESFITHQQKSSSF